jgi:hypothetical protein
MGEMRNACRVLGGQCEGKTPCGRLERRLGDIKIDLKNGTIAQSGLF